MNIKLSIPVKQSEPLEDRAETKISLRPNGAHDTLATAES